MADDPQEFWFRNGDHAEKTACDIYVFIREHMMPKKPLENERPNQNPYRPQCDPKVGNNAQKLDWISAHMDDAAKVAQELGVTPAEILGLSALESGWGTGRFAREGNNFCSQH